MTTSAEIAIRAALAEGSARDPARDVHDEQRRRSFERLISKHAAMVHAVARRMAPRGEVEDVVQETYVRAWRGLARFRSDADLSTWLYRILVNLCRDRFRRRARAGVPAIERSVPVDPAAGAARRELVERIFAVVETLAARQREALLLRVRARLSYVEIARVMGVRVGTVKSHLVQARRHLLERFGAELPEFEGSKR